MAPPSVIAVRSSRSKKRSSKRDPKRPSKARRKSLPESEHDSTEDSLDLDEVRKARADYYSQTPEQRRAREKETSKGQTTGPRKAGENSTMAKSKGSGPGTKALGERDAKGRAHARKRRKRSRKENIDDSSSEAKYVYAQKPKPAERSTRPKEKPAHKPKMDEQDSESGYVYKDAVRHSSAPTILRTSSVRTSSSRPRTATASQHRTSTQPSNPFLRALGLQPPGRPAPRRSSTPSTTPSTVNRTATTRRASSSTRAPLPRRPSSSRKSAAATSSPSLPRRSASVNTTSTKPPSRPGLMRSHTTTNQARRSSKPLETIAETHEDRTAKMKRPTSMFGAIFGSSKPAAPEPRYVIYIYLVMRVLAFLWFASRFWFDLSIYVGHTCSCWDL